MNFDFAIDEIRKSWKELYPEDGSKKGIICPICGSGSGKNGTGIRENPKAARQGSLKCFSCGFSGDVIDLLEAERKLTTEEAIREAASALGISIDAPARTRSRTRDDSTKGDKYTSREKKAPQANYTAYYEKCRERIEDEECKSYLIGRGICIENAIDAGLGYDPESDPAQRGFTAKRIIVPCSENYFVARSIDPETDKKYRVMASKGGTGAIFNIAELFSGNNKFLFVTEGIFDALSVREAGSEAIALNSTGNYKILLDQISGKKNIPFLLLALDNDEAGQNATVKLARGLSELGIAYATANICGQKKDPNEALLDDRQKFIDSVKEAQKKAARPDSTSFYIRDLMAKEIEVFRRNAARKTGFKDFDRMTGGIFPGLYVIGAVSSLGKTTFALQCADQLAASGEDVLIFSLEQSRLELVSKSISRITAQNDIETAKTSLEIRNGDLTPEVLSAAQQYDSITGGRISIIEGNFASTLSDIEAYVKTYIDANNVLPVIIIDYLQIIQDNSKLTTKDRTDLLTTNLKRMSRNNNVPVLVISSLNRQNYLQPVDYESFKESGSIEYGADVVLGLQFDVINSDLFSKKEAIKEKREKIREAKSANPRKIQCVCLKNRYGKTGFSIRYAYYPKFDFFIEEGVEDDS